MRAIRVGLLGIGTVGGGTWEVLNRNAGEIRRRAGRAIRIARVADKDLNKARRLVDGKAALHRDAAMSAEQNRSPNQEGIGGSC